MATTVQNAHGPDSEALESAIDAALEDFEERLRTLSRVEVLEILIAATRALEEPAGPVQPVIARLTGGKQSTPAERVATKIAVLLRSFERRRELLDDALTTSQVAKLLGTSRQTPHDRMKNGSLLAVMDRGALRFPPWQFDPEGEDGVVSGLPQVIRALEITPYQKVSWLTRPNYMLDDATPLVVLKRGEVDRVVRLARGVGFN
jgi:hypothetical protein